MRRWRAVLLGAVAFHGEVEQRAQFNHRVLALVTFAAILVFWLSVLRSSLTGCSRSLAGWLGALHQAGALVLFTLAVMTLHSLRQRAG